MPVATDDEGTVKGAKEPENRGCSDQTSAANNSLPPSSPIDSWTEKSVGGDEPRAHVARGREGSVASYNTQGMWSAAGSVPGVFLFDDHEAGPREEGEIEEGTKAGGANADADADDEDEDEDEADREAYKKRMEKWEDFLSKQSAANPQSNLITTSRKRSWKGSVRSEERNRSARRPRREEGVEKAASVRLPSIQDLVGNPWGGAESGDDDRIRLPFPVHMSTPQNNHQSPLLNMRYQSGANMSGKAPTPHSVGTVAPAERHRAPVRLAGEGAGKRGPRAGAHRTRRASSYVDAMDMDLGDGESLLQSPDLRRARKERDRRELEELEERRRELQQAIREEEAIENDGWTPHRREHWQGGYAPELMGRSGTHADAPRPRKAVDDLNVCEESSGGERSEGELGVGDESSHYRSDQWSAVPNTKAWQYNEARRAREQGRREEGGGVPDRDTRDAQQWQAMDAPPAGQSEARRSEAAGQRETEWRNVGRPTSASQRGIGRGEGPMDFDDASWEGGVAGRRGGPGVGGAIPTIVAREEGVADMPVTVEDPHDARWEVHFEDPETLLRGQSADFVRIVWWDDAPTVIFAVYNYKYTANDAVLRHIETAVTNLTTVLTGEVGFHVVPPDPDRCYTLQSRDLPFVWAIRGLSEAGAWEMVKTRVATTKGVTIITYPRSLTNPRWVCGLGGFLRPDTAAIKSAVLGVLRSEYMVERLADLTRSNDLLNHIPEGRRVEYVIRSLEIKVSTTGEGAYVANIYMTPPTDDMDAWREWAEEMRVCRFNSFLCGAGVARKVFWCAGCRGVDHEDHDCVFPKMRGWKGPDAGSGSHTKQPIMGAARSVSRGGIGRARGNVPRGGMRNGAQSGWQGPSEHWDAGGGRNQNGYGRGGGPSGRGAGRGYGGHSARGMRGLKQGTWSPMVTRR